MFKPFNFLCMVYKFQIIVVAGGEGVAFSTKTYTHIWWWSIWFHLTFEDWIRLKCRIIDCKKRRDIIIDDDSSSYANLNLIPTIFQKRFYLTSHLYRVKCIYNSQLPHYIYRYTHHYNVQKTNTQSNVIYWKT